MAGTTQRQPPYGPRGSFTPKLVTTFWEGYGLKAFRNDALAGLTVAVIALPLAMALGIASGASPDRGLITAIVAGFTVSALGGSRVQIGGPTGAFVVVIFNVIALHGYDGLILATALAGIILVIAGYAGLGGIIRYIPQPVIIGFTAGIAVIIATSQIQNLFGLAITDLPAGFLEKWEAYLGALTTIDRASTALGLAILALIIIMQRFVPRLPAFLVAIIAGSIAVPAFGLDVDTIGSHFPSMSTGLSLPSFPDLSLAKAQEVLPSAFTIAFLAGIEALLSCVVADGMTGFRHRSNQELVGQGAANIASAMFGGLPATGALARTAANIKAGGRTPVAGIFHSAFLLLFVLLASDLMAFVPMAVLAAVLLMVAWGMSEARRFLFLLRMPAAERAILLLTFLLTVLIDLTVAIGVGVTLASLTFMARMSEAAGVRPDDIGEEDVSQRERLPAGVEVFRINGPFFFGVASELLDILKRIGTAPKAIILRLEEVSFIDASGSIALREFLEQAGSAGIKIVLCAIPTDQRPIVESLHDPEKPPPLMAPDFEAALRLAAALPDQ
ncbi:SulP family inorganic anion transporter [Sphingosinicella rhizophila]|uniref:SulP family inorganic anion transporter n=1 Tax=Sphingosinicella rhizophila TaxID=3050082 RepID=A0ABU3Q6G5_9SPHN|nr:SulP family inorganic anion transporter [Sphingosinicella sp. GR2756]MDT9598996.1 SulP family inorganic anion transporter [Sphingosinicella sp. GR2756]